MFPKPRYIVYFIIGVFLSFNIELLVNYYHADKELAEVEYERLLDLYDSIRMNYVVLELISSVDTSYLWSQYEINRIMYRYDFDYETAKILYQYHQYHNIRIGSIDSLVEYQALANDDLLDFLYNDEEPEPPTLPPSLEFLQTQRILTVVFICYWIICILPRPRYRKSN